MTTFPPHFSFLKLIFSIVFIIFSTKAATIALTTITLHDFQKRNNMVVRDYRFSYR